MNTGPADTRFPHLDLADLIAEVNRQAIDDRAREHLTSCEHCRAEANRWNLVADGVRSLVDATPETAPPARPRHTRLRLLARPRPRTVLAASAAAALVLLAGVGYGAGAIHIGHAPGPVLTAVSGCTALEQASGTLEQASGASLVIRPASGQPVTVTTGPQTLLVMSGALLNDVTDGASVLVLGASSGGTIAARSVTVGPGASTTGPAGPPPGLVVARGTVSDASSAGFTVATASGTPIPVTTSGETVVTVTHVSPGQLPAGATIYTLGQAGPHGTLSARAVAAVSQLPAGRHISVTVRNCSPTSIAEALAAISAAPFSGR